MCLLPDATQRLESSIYPHLAPHHPSPINPARPPPQTHQFIWSGMLHMLNSWRQHELGLPPIRTGNSGGLITHVHKARPCLRA